MLKKQKKDNLPDLLKADHACHLLSGYIAGWFEKSFDLACICIETKCRVSGSPLCEFLVFHTTNKDIPLSVKKSPQYKIYNSRMTIQKLYNADSSVEWMEKRISRKKLLRSKSTESTGRSDPHINTDAVFTSSQKYDHYDDLKKMNILSTHSGVSINASATPPNYKLRRKSTGKKRKIRSKSTHKPKAKVKDDTSSREGSGNLPIRKSPK